jgi:AmmeMemoRadiSam system protein A
VIEYGGKTMNTVFTLNAEQKRLLLTLARRTVEACVTGRPIPDEKPDDPKLAEPCGCFVTLHVAGELRGCIGTFLSQTPLYATIREMAQESLQDTRFLDRPIRPADLDQLEIEISVLSPLEKTDDPLSLELGKHGIYIKRGYMSGCFLPQVATETGWSKEEFLGYCCSHKAGLPSNAWKDPKTTVYLFTAEVFSEGEV